MENKTIIIQPKTSASSVEMNNDLSAIKDFFFVCLVGWKWFVLSSIISVSCAFLYLQTTEPLYTRSASVHIKEDSHKGSISNISEEFSTLGIGNTGMSVNNEVVAFNSLELAEQVVKVLNLNISYKTEDGMRRKVLFGDALPINVLFTNLKDEESISLSVEMLSSGKVRAYDFVYNEEKVDFDKEAPFNTPISSPAGDIIISQTTKSLDPLTQKIYVSHIPLSAATNMLHDRLEAVQNNNKNSVIDITYKDENIERAESVINTLISEYNKNWIKDKNELGVLTSQFIDVRINAIQKELGGVDSDIASYKSANLITDPMQAASLMLNQANQSDQQLLALSNQISMCNYLHDYIAHNANKLIPANIGIQSTDVAALVAAYNEKMIKRNTYAGNSSESNPMVQNLDDELTAQRSAIIQSLENEKRNLESQMNASRKTVRQSQAQLSSSPTLEKNLLSMDRQQKVKEALYLFLLQKREENELSQAFTAYNTRVISRPMGSNTPTSPVPMRIYLVVMIVALILPVVILYIRELLNTQVRGRKDLEKLSVPFAGEIPEMNETQKWFNKLIGRRKKNKQYKVVVQQGQRDIVNEAFRVVRTNLNFMLRPNINENRQVVLLTSANPGSGKTFLSINLAASFCLQNKTKVIILDLDIRKATLSKVIGSPQYGIADYLGGFKNEWKDLIHQVDDKAAVDILPVGHIPPNPAELLQSERMKTLIEELKTEYNIIFMDMPPAEAVADVSIVKHLVDLTLYVVRAGHMERSMLSVIENYYKDKTFNNLAILLNGSELHYSRYGYGGYVYGYGYGYGNTKN